MATVKYNRAAYDYQIARVAEMTARLTDAKETLAEIEANLVEETP